MELGTNLAVTIAAGALTAVACWLVLYGTLLLFQGHEARVRSRIREFVSREGDEVVTESQQRSTLRTTLFRQIDSRASERSWLTNLFARTKEDIAKADLHITVTELLLTQFSVGAALGLMLWLLLAPSIGQVLFPVGFLVGILLTRSYLVRLGKRRIKKFEDQLPDILSVLASSVRGGFSLFQALQLIAKEAAEPSRTEFLRVIQEVSLGSPMPEALNGLAVRIPTEDVDILVTAISLQSQTGGNLSHVLDIVATTIRERHRVEREIKSLTAQQRVSASMLAAIPVLLGVVIYAISPQYISRLFAWGWVLCLPGGAFVSTIVGLILMRRLSAIDV